MTQTINTTLFGVILDRANHNGRIYSEACFNTEEVKRQIEAKLLPVMFPGKSDMTPRVNDDQICGFVRDLTVEGTEVQVAVELVDGLPMTVFAKLALANGYKFTPVGTGKVAPDGTVSEYVLHSVAITGNP
jgi:hypothetical protein